MHYLNKGLLIVLISMVSMMALGQNAPIALNDSFPVPSGILSTIDILANDIEPDGTSMAVLSTSIPANGIVTNGLFVNYESNAGYLGLDSFFYVIIDTEGLVDTATVILNVLAPNLAPIAEPDSFSVLSGITDTLILNSNDGDPDFNQTQISWLSSSANAQLAVVNDSSIIYTSDPPFIGTDTIYYFICDDGIPSLCSDTTEIFIQVSSFNNAPIAKPDSFSVFSGVSDTLILNTNDEDPDLDDFFIGWVSASTNGVLSLVNDSSIVYTSNPSFIGTDTVYYFICDDGIPSLCSDTVEIIVEVISINNPPDALDDYYTMSQEDSLSIQPLINDEELDGESMSLNSLISGPSSGSVSFQMDSLLYIPDSCYVGTDSIFYLVCDDEPPALCDSAWIFIEVSPMTYFTAEDDNYIISSLDPLIFDVQNNDFIYPGLIAITDIINSSSMGMPSLVNNDSILYIPNANFLGSDTLRYRLCDHCDICDTAELIIEYIPPSAGPTAVNDTILLLEDHDSIILVLLNDIDPFGTGLTAGLVDPPDNGIVSILGAGEFYYQPNTNYFGSDTFTYVVCAPTNGLCDTAEVIINISSVDDPVIALDDLVNGIEDQTLTVSVLNNDVDVDSFPLEVSIISGPNSGVANVLYGTDIQYIPNLNFNGMDQITYLVCDTVSPILCDTAIVNISIIAVNDPPFANDDNATTLEDNIMTIFPLQNDQDTDGNAISASFIYLPANGSAIFLNNDSILYNPAINFNGLDSIVYLLCDDLFPPLCDTATIYIEVLAVNDKPLALNDNEITEEGFQVNIDVQANDTDVEGQPLLTSIITQPFNGSVTILSDESIVYQPLPGYSGTDQLTYAVCDNGAPILCDTAMVFLSILNNPYPVAVNDTAYTDSGVSVNINVLGNDFDLNDTDLNYSLLSPPSDGNALNNFNGSFSYIPDAGFQGWDMFTYTIRDDGMPQGEDVGTAYILVTIPNDAPVANNDTLFILEGDSALINVLNNDSDMDGDSLTVSMISNASLGNVLLNPDGTISYTGIYGNNGIDIIEYEVCDSLGACDIGFLVVQVQAFNANEILTQIPNAFTPNEDGYNDVFKIPNIELYNSNLMVFNRWGETVYSATDYNNNWGGTFESTNIKLPSGTYYYTLKLQYATQNEQFSSGYIQIID